jgi:tRNA threonylcarbamoyladenosine biosynthesis protein TsaE
VTDATCVSMGEARTETLGRFIGTRAVAGDVYLMSGDLGAGKTCLIRGIAAGLGVAEHAFSPSFVLVRQYSGRLTLYHMDFYRLESPEEIADLGIEEYLSSEGVCAIEWAERATGLLPHDALSVELSYIIGSPDVRRIRFKATGQRYTRLLHTLRQSSGSDIEWS